MPEQSFIFRVNMEKAHPIQKNYSTDVENFNSWFAADMEQVKKSTLNFNPITGLLRKVRMTPGIEGQIEILNDLEDLGLSVELLNIVNLKPFSISIPWQGRIRTTPFNPLVDKIFDYDLPARECTLNLTLAGHPTSNVKWISKDVIVTDADKNKRDFSIEEDTFIPDGAWIMRGDQVVMFDNRFNNEHLYFVQIGFENNPTYEEVKEKFSKLA
jgi:hypothetical protein